MHQLHALPLVYGTGWAKKTEIKVSNYIYNVVSFTNKLGGIQEDRQKVKLFHFVSVFLGTAIGWF